MEKLIVDIRPLLKKDREKLKKYLNDNKIEYSKVSMPPEYNEPDNLPNNAFQEMEE